MKQHLFRPTVSTAIVAATVAVAWFAAQGLAQPSGSGPEIEQPAEGTQIFIMPRSGPFSPEAVAVPNARVIAAWARSGHSNALSEAFVHWNEEGAIPATCAVCHSGIGFRIVPRARRQRARRTRGAGRHRRRRRLRHLPQSRAISSITEISATFRRRPSGRGRRGLLHHLPPGPHRRRRRGRGDWREAGGYDRPGAALRQPTLRAGGGHLARRLCAAAATSIPDRDYSGRFLHAKPGRDLCLLPRSAQPGRRRGDLPDLPRGGDPDAIRMAPAEL